MSHHPGPGYGQPFPPHDGGVSDGQAERPSTLGILSLALVGLYLVAVLAVNLLGSVVVVPLWDSADSTGQMTASGLSGFSAGQMLILKVSGAIGLTGWIVGIVATVTNRGRSFGIAAIVLGLVTVCITSAMLFGVLFVKVLG
jgi:hypothetical protein